MTGGGDGRPDGVVGRTVLPADLPLTLRLVSLIFVLVALQVIRAAFSFVQYQLAGIRSWDQIHLVSLVAMGAVAWLVVRPGWRELGLSWRDLSSVQRVHYLNLGGALVAAVIWTEYRLDRGMVHNLTYVLVVPLVEELLFRGMGWCYLSGDGRTSFHGWTVLLLTTGLFVLWHLGYLDWELVESLTSTAKQSGRLDPLWIKLGSSLLVGLMTGGLRWMTGRVYAPFLAHGLWNLVSAAP